MIVSLFIPVFKICLNRWVLEVASHRRTAFPSENGQYHGFEDDESYTVYMYFFANEENNNNDNNNNMLATKDSNHCNLTTSKILQ